jgi:hypothetical protein
MAAIMSRAFPFSPLAMGTDEGGDALAGGDVGSTGELGASAVADVVVTGGGSAVSGFIGWESKRLGCRDDFSRAT